MKKTILISLVLAVVVAIGSYIVYSTMNQAEASVNGGRQIIGYNRMWGTASYLPLMPSYVNNFDSTSTVTSTVTSTITQAINIKGMNNISLSIASRANNAGSYCSLLVMESPDGTNYYDVGSSTLSLNGATSTLVFGKSAIQYQPGITTSTQVIALDLPVSSFLRLIPYSTTSDCYSSMVVNYSEGQ